MAKRTQIRVGDHQGTPCVEQIKFGTPADFKFFRDLDVVLLQDGAEITVQVIMLDSNGVAISPIIHSPFTGGKFDVSITEAVKKSLGCEKVVLWQPTDEAPPAEEEAEEEEGEEEEEEYEEEEGEEEYEEEEDDEEEEEEDEEEEEEEDEEEDDEDVDDEDDDEEDEEEDDEDVEYEEDDEEEEEDDE